MRLYELAAALHLTVPDVRGLLAEQGVEITAALGAVPQALVLHLVERHGSDDVHEVDNDSHLQVPRRPAAAAPAPRVPRPLPHPRPGPAPISLKPAAPVADEREAEGRAVRRTRHADKFADRVTTRDAAELARVSQATIRQWVKRGYLVAVDKVGVSNVFNREDVIAARDAVANRTRSPGRRALRSRELPWTITGDLLPLVPDGHRDVLVTIPQAASLARVRPATIRSWLYRGHLRASRQSTPREVLIRISDLLDTAEQLRYGRTR